MSTAVEHVFSQGQQLLHFTHNQLSPSTICANLCLGSWARHGLMSISDLIKVTKVRSNKRKLESDSENVEVE
jgi:hypothetical protein